MVIINERKSIFLDKVKEKGYGSSGNQGSFG